jgi:membrane associated rhomboid family serine protease
MRRLWLSPTLPFPWATSLLVLGCVVTTAPMFISRDFYLVLGAGHETADTPQLSWWHPFVTPFVHGGGFPGTSLHLAINCTLFVFLGTLVERTLGAGRFMLLTGTCLAVNMVLKEWLVGGRAHGASGMTWSYLLFGLQMLRHVFRRDRARALRDPVLWVDAVLLVFCVVGLVKHWHLWDLLASVPFFLAWRGLLSRRLEAIDAGHRAPERSWADRAGIAAAGLLCSFTSFMAVAAILGRIG